MCCPRRLGNGNGGLARQPGDPMLPRPAITPSAPLAPRQRSASSGQSRLMSIRQAPAASARRPASAMAAGR